jgi:hypothetical protein
MDVSLDEHRLGGLRWIVVRGPDRAAFRALGEHMRAEMAALIQTWDLVDKLRRHVSGPPGRERMASVRQASERDFPEAWAELTAFAEGAGVPFGDLSLGDPSVTLCTIVADLTAGEAVLAARGEPPATISLRDLAEGRPALS